LRFFFWDSKIFLLRRFRDFSPSKNLSFFLQDSEFFLLRIWSFACSKIPKFRRDSEKFRQDFEISLKVEKFDDSARLEIPRFQHFACGCTVPRF
jgi:hypothetical protein